MSNNEDIVPPLPNSKAKKPSALNRSSSFDLLPPLPNHNQFLLKKRKSADITFPTSPYFKNLQKQKKDEPPTPKKTTNQFKNEKAKDPPISKDVGDQFKTNLGGQESLKDDSTRHPLLRASDSLPAHPVRPTPVLRRYTVGSYFTKATVSRPGLSTPMSTSAFVSQMPSQGLRSDKIDWVYPAKDYVPKKHKVKISVWSDLTLEHLERLNECQNTDSIKQTLSEIFTINNYNENIKMGIIMDLYFYTLQFARKQAFSPEKTSTFFSIVKLIFEVCIETPFGNLDQTFSYFKDLLHTHSVNRPPFSIEIFNTSDVRNISEYVINTFFRHFKMYKYVFTPFVRLNLSINYLPEIPDTELTPLSDIVDKEEEEQHKEESVESLSLEEDEERIAAKKELKGIVKDFLFSESRKIEGKVEISVKTMVEALNSKIDDIVGVEKTVNSKHGKR